MAAGNLTINVQGPRKLHPAEYIASDALEDTLVKLNEANEAAKGTIGRNCGDGQAFGVLRDQIIDVMTACKRVLGDELVRVMMKEKSS